MKAFDSLNWRFIECTLHAFGFPNFFVKWIMTCITSTSFSIAINGSLEGYFKGANGIRQGDPLSPYIFVICMEVLSCMLNKMEQDQKFGFHPKCAKLRLNHLCFADDLFIFCKGNINSLECIMDVLENFFSLSGLKVNSSKSDIFFGGVLNETKHAILSKMNFKEGNLPIRYLGVPLVSRKLRKADCLPLLEKINRRPESWTNHWLSYMGRLTLIKSTLLQICSFWAGALLLPKSIIQKIESKFCAFLWKDTGAKIAWKDICVPLDEGGLGIRKIEDINNTFLLKSFWRMYVYRDSLWSKWMQSNYIKDKSIWTLTTSKDDSWVPKNLLKYRAIARAHISHVLGNGKQTLFRHDKWHIHGILSNFWSSTFNNPPYYAKVCDIYTYGNWNWPIHLLHFDPPCTNLVEENLDVITWDLSPNGDFTFSHTWEEIRMKKNKVDWHNIVWFKGHTPRHAFITWLAIHDRLSTKFRLLSWGKDVNPTCIFCNFGCETRDHLFFNCSFTRRIWSKGLHLTMIQDALIDWEDIFAFITPLALGKNLKATILKHLLEAAIYYIWIERNHHEFHKSFKTEEQLFSSIYNHVRLKCIVGKHFTPSSLNRKICKLWGMEEILL